MSRADPRLPFTRIFYANLRPLINHSCNFFIGDPQHGVRGMTTPNQISRKLKSLDYRQKLIEDMDSLETEIAGCCREYGTDVLMGYKVNMDNGRVTLKKLPVKDQKQLET